LFGSGEKESKILMPPALPMVTHYQEKNALWEKLFFCLQVPVWTLLDFAPEIALGKFIRRQWL
jgi:hypothetical protein